MFSAFTVRSRSVTMKAFALGPELPHLGLSSRRVYATDPTRLNGVSEDQGDSDLIVKSNSGGEVEGINKVLTIACQIRMIAFLADTLFKQPLRCFHRALPVATEFQLVAQMITGAMTLVVLWISHRMQTPYILPLGLCYTVYVAGTYGVAWNLVLFGGIGVASVTAICKGFLTDVVSGLRLKVEKPISKYDYIEVGKSKGVVMDIGLQETMLFNVDEDSEITVRNSLLFGNIKFSFGEGKVVDTMYVPGIIQNILSTKFAEAVSEACKCRLTKIEGLMVD